MQKKKSAIFVYKQESFEMKSKEKYSITREDL